MMSVEDAVAEYRTSLLELQFNSKPHINMLTMLAEESQQFAAEIVEVIESRLFEAAPAQKLPVLYLIDSIVKNCPDAPYRDLFGKNLIGVFVHVFQQADEKTRQSLFKLRQTWPDFFPGSKLYRIDIKVHEIDPAWPLQDPSQLKVATAVRKNVYVNPKFIEQDNASAEHASTDKAPRRVDEARHQDLVRLQEELQTERKNMLGKKQQSEVGDVAKRAPADGASSLPIPTDPRIRKKELEMRPKLPEGAPNGPDPFADAHPPAARVDVDRGQAKKRDSEGASRFSRKEVGQNRRSRDHLSPPSPKKRASHRQSFGRSSPASPSHRRREPVATGFRATGPRYLLKGKTYSSHRRSRFDIMPQEKVPLLPGSPPYECNAAPEVVLEPPAPPPPPVQQFLDPRLQARMMPDVRVGMHPMDVRSGPVMRQGVLGPSPATTVYGVGPAFAAPMPTVDVSAYRASGPCPDLARGFGHVSSMGMDVNASSSVASLAEPPWPSSIAVGGGGPGANDVQAVLKKAVVSVEVVPDDSVECIPLNNRLFVDGLAYEVRFIDEVAVIERNGLPHRIYFVGFQRDVVVDGVPYSLSFSDPRTVLIDGQPISLRFGAPSRELYVGSVPLRASFGGPPVWVLINQVKHKIQLCGPPPEVKIDPEPAYELIRYMSSSHVAKRSESDSSAMGDGARRSALLSPKSAQPVVPRQASSAVATDNVIELLDKLVKSGIIGQQGPTVAAGEAAVPMPPHSASSLSPVNTLYEATERRQAPTAELKSFNFNHLKIRYTKVIDSLHEHKIQCSTCGMRFPVNENAKYAKHLDWHFKMNRRDKFSRGAVSRPWFLTLEDVVNYEELGEDITTKVKSSVFESMQKQKEKSAGLVVSTDSVALASDIEQFCAVCRESFEQFFDQDDDVWKLRNAVNVDGTAYHPLCYQDIAPLKECDQSDEEEDANADGGGAPAVKIEMKEEDEEMMKDGGGGDSVAELTSSRSDILQSILSVFCKVSASSNADLASAGQNSDEHANSCSTVQVNSSAPVVAGRCGSPPAVVGPLGRRAVNNESEVRGAQVKTEPHSP